MLFQPFHYLAQDSLPWKISWANPKIRITKITPPLARVIIKLDIITEGRIGKIKISSTSKIRKIMATKKNRIEKGSRDIVLGENPHSNGLYFSRSEKDFKPKIFPNKKSKRAKNKIIIIIGIINLNVYRKLTLV